MADAAKTSIPIIRNFFKASSSAFACDATGNSHSNRLFHFFPIVMTGCGLLRFSEFFQCLEKFQALDSQHFDYPVTRLAALLMKRSGLHGLDRSRRF